MEKRPCVYILANKKNGTIYTGVTSNLVKRIYQHKHHLIDGFTKKYNTTQLVWYEHSENMLAAISREKQIKGWLRQKKIALIEQNNLEWRDLYTDIL